MGFIDTFVKTAVGFATGGPVGAVVGFTSADQQERAKSKRKRIEQQIHEENIRRGKIMSEIFGTGNVSRIQAPTMGSTANAGFGSGFGQFLSDVGSNIVNPFTNFFTSLSPFLGGGQPSQPAITTNITNPPAETSTSGTLDAFSIPNILGPAINLGKSLIKSPIGGGVLGTGVGTVVGSLIGPDGKPMRVTRKIKSQAKMLLNMTGGNLQATADMLGIDQQTLVFILLKRFRNDGPVVTKAALRKTKQTVRRLKNMCDMYDSLRPNARRRTTPMKRASSTTLIKN